ncbi:MAG: alpha/beta fold hydrolase [Candidatus Eisenbacteria bacterium]|nr:alpha/beta fold hydrolase [Candidatus Eisenbacteria bacterium]
MKRLLVSLSRIVISALTLFAISGTAGVSAQSPGNTGSNIEGTWQGVVKFGGVELRVVFNISREPSGALKATLDSPDQGATGIVVDDVIFDGSNVRLGIQSVAGSFEGKFRGDGSAIEGNWSQGGVTIPLTLERSEKKPEVKRPQEPKKPYPYREEEVSYKNENAGITLAGTLTLPEGKGPFPAVILITGSGPQDRDETVFGHRPFLVLADYLTRHGIAVLRVDDRGVGSSTGSFSQATSESSASDVLAGIKYLKSRNEVNQKKIGLIGHSEGGIIAPMVAVQSKDIAFIVLMAGTGLTGEQILYLQGALIAKANGASDEEIAENRALQERMFTVLKQEKDDAVASKKLREIMLEALKTMTDDEKKAFGHSEAAIDPQLRQLMSPWFRTFLTYDPKPALMKVKCPVLAINGEKDLQVPPDENLAAIKDALVAGRNKHYSIRELEGLNHLFQPSQTGTPLEYGKIEETMSPTALKMIADWIQEKTQRK